MDDSGEKFVSKEKGSEYAAAFILRDIALNFGLRLKFIEFKRVEGLFEKKVCYNLLFKIMSKPVWFARGYDYVKCGWDDDKFMLDVDYNKSRGPAEEMFKKLLNKNVVFDEKFDLKEDTREFFDLKKDTR